MPKLSNDHVLVSWSVLAAAGPQFVYMLLRLLIYKFLHKNTRASRKAVQASVVHGQGQCSCNRPCPCKNWLYLERHMQRVRGEFHPLALQCPASERQQGRTYQRRDTYSKKASEKQHAKHTTAAFLRGSTVGILGRSQVYRLRRAAGSGALPGFGSAKGSMQIHTCSSWHPQGKNEQTGSGPSKGVHPELGFLKGPNLHHRVVGI